MEADEIKDRPYISQPEGYPASSGKTGCYFRRTGRRGSEEVEGAWKVDQLFWSLGGYIDVIDLKA